MPHVYRTVRQVEGSEFAKVVEKLEDQGFTLLNSGYAVWIEGSGGPTGYGYSSESTSTPQWWAILRKPK